MHGDKLPLKSGHEFGDRQPVLFENARNLVGVSLAFRATMQVEKACVGARKLKPLVAEARSPFGDPREGVERGAVIRKLCDEQRWSFDCAH